MPHKDPGADGEDRSVTQDQPDPEAGYEGQEHVLLQADIGPQEMNAMLEIIFEINNLRGSCGHRSERKETPTRGAPYTLVTVFFPETIVAYAEQLDWRFKGINGAIHLQGAIIRDIRLQVHG
jgi:hypothetical protein